MNSPEQTRSVGESSRPSEELGFQQIRAAVEGNRYCLNKLIGRATEYSVSEDAWNTLQEWKGTIDSQIVKVRAYLAGDTNVFPATGRKKELATMCDVLGSNPRDQDVILYCIGDALLNLNPRRWNSRLFVIARGLLGGRRDITNYGKDANGIVDTCLDTAALIDALARMYGIDGRVIIAKGGHAHWEENGENGAIVDLPYGWERRGLFHNQKEYSEQVEKSERYFGTPRMSSTGQ